MPYVALIYQTKTQPLATKLKVGQLVIKLITGYCPKAGCLAQGGAAMPVAGSRAEI